MATYATRPTIDSHMDQKQPDANYGQANAVEMGPTYYGGSKDKLRRAIANFNVSALQGRTITAAQIRRVISGAIGPPQGFAATIYRCTRPATWTETGVTWNKYNGANNWTTAGGDYDQTTPAPVHYIETTNPIPGLKDFVIDALNNRTGIVSIIIRVDNENPGVTTWASWWSRQYQMHIWRLEVDHSGDPIGLRKAVERGFLRGAQRGVMRGV